MLGRLNHVAIAVKDITSAANTYRDILGAKVGEPLNQKEQGVLRFFGFWDRKSQKEHGFLRFCKVFFGFWDGKSQGDQSFIRFFGIWGLKTKK